MLAPIGSSMTRRRHERSFARQCAGIGAAIVLSLGAGVARADAPDYPPCTKKPTPPEVELAKGAHKEATDYNARGDYDKAIQYWHAAYGFDCTAHKILLNIALAYEKKGDKAAAVATYQVYLERANQKDPEYANIPEKVANLKAAIAAAQSNPTPQEPTTGPTGPVGPRQLGKPGERPYGIKPWILVAGGGVFVIVGGILAPVGYSAISSAELACPTHVGCTPDVASQGNTGRLEVGLGWTAIVVGAAAVGGGLVWQFVLNKPGSGGPTQGATLGPLAHVDVAPVIAPKQGGLALSGSF
jgi:hypothetical protein